MRYSKYDRSGAPEHATQSWCHAYPVGRERLRVDAPTGVLTDDMQQAIRTHKAALIELVEEIEERACIGEFCGGLAREEAERLAWACVLGKVTV